MSFATRAASVVILHLISVIFGFMNWGHVRLYIYIFFFSVMSFLKKTYCSSVL